MAKRIEMNSEPARIVAEEELLLLRVEERLAQAVGGDRGLGHDYDEELISLRDQVAEAKPEDIAPLVEQMARASAIAARRGRGRELPLDPASPYFAHLRLSEQGRERDVLIGKRGLIDRAAGVQIVDWRNAPVSRIYYRYEEGDDYDEQLPGGRLSGTVEARRNLSIAAGRLRRIGCPQGTFVSDARGDWVQAEGTITPTLHGGQGTAARAPQSTPRKRGEPRERGRLGVDGPVPRADKRLPEIAALIDREQFDLITRPDAGLVVIEGGAGSGKTTVALHRVAWLNYQDPRRFRGRRMLVVVPTQALSRYVEGVLPALGVPDVQVMTVAGWMRWVRRRVVPSAPDKYTDDTPALIARAKKHPALLRGLERYAQGRKDAAAEGGAKRPSPLTVWAEFLTDAAELRAALPREELSDGDIAQLVAWCAAQQDEPVSSLIEGIDDPERAAPVDGRPLDEDSVAQKLDHEDDALLLRLVQLLRGGLAAPAGALRPGESRPTDVEYEHIAIDEAQDLSVPEVKVLLGATTSARSITMCGDSAQRLVFDNAFSGFDALLGEVGFSRQVVRPLGLSYRSTYEVGKLARAVLGDLAPKGDLIARPGEPVELHSFEEMGEAVAFLGDALRSLMGREPMAQVALITRHAAQSDAWYAALAQAEVPALRRVRKDEFPFRPGIDVTDVAQVKGLEFDYVVLLDASAQSYPPTIESRHLLHIGATRAAHQLWLVTIGPPSPLLPAFEEAPAPAASSQLG
jgi:DNA helicase-2/ATP-dependent DNA helicase PcrA